MKWKENPELTRIARAGSGGNPAPTVKQNGTGQFLLSPTPHGRVELIEIQPDRFLLASETLPEGAPELSAALFSPDLIKHLRSNGVRPWRIVRGTVEEILQSLVEGELWEGGTDPEDSGPRVPANAERLHRELPLKGESRAGVCRHLTGHLIAQETGTPHALYLYGPHGVGKRTMVCAACEELGKEAWEVPLGWALVERMLQSNEEFILQLILQCRNFSRSREDVVLVLSDADLLLLELAGRAPGMFRELRRLGRIVFLGERCIHQFPLPAVQLECPGMHASDARHLVQEQLGIEVTEEAFNHLSAVCRVPGEGAPAVNPGRLLNLVMCAAQGQAVTAGKGRKPARVHRDDAVSVSSMLIPEEETRLR